MEVHQSCVLTEPITTVKTTLLIFFFNQIQRKSNKKNFSKEKKKRENEWMKSSCIGECLSKKSFCWITLIYSPDCNRYGLFVLSNGNSSNLFFHPFSRDIRKNVWISQATMYYLNVVDVATYLHQFHSEVTSGHDGQRSITLFRSIKKNPPYWPMPPIYIYRRIFFPSLTCQGVLSPVLFSNQSDNLLFVQDNKSPSSSTWNLYKRGIITLLQPPISKQNQPLCLVCLIIMYFLSPMPQFLCYICLP